MVLLDVGLPGEDGLSLARFLRERHQVGIIMVTAADGIVDRVVGLEMGADDYVAKPFDPRELRARLKSVLRRLHGDAAPAATAGRTLPRIGRCMLDLDTRRLLDAGGTDIPITAMEFDLLKNLYRASEQGTDARSAADADAQPRVGTVRPLDRHPHRPVATQG